MMDKSFSLMAGERVRLPDGELLALIESVELERGTHRDMIHNEGDNISDFDK